MTTKDITKEIITKFTKHTLIQNANKNANSLNGFLSEYVAKNYSVSDKDIDEVINGVMDYYNL